MFLLNRRCVCGLLSLILNRLTCRPPKLVMVRFLKFVEELVACWLFFVIVLTLFCSLLSGICKSMIFLVLNWFLSPTFVSVWPLFDRRVVMFRLCIAPMARSLWLTAVSVAILSNLSLNLKGLLFCFKVCQSLVRVRVTLDDLALVVSSCLAAPLDKSSLELSGLFRRLI